MRAETLVILTVAVLVTGVAACGDRGDTAEETAAEEAMQAQHMQEHFSYAVALRDAVIGGDLAATEEPATWMSEHEMAGGLPEGWEPYVAEMRTAAGAAAAATELEAAASAAGMMAAQCGACHQAEGATMAVSIGQPPAAEPGTAAHMARHQWAMQRLWEGLVTPSDAAWTAGLQVLADEPLAAGSFSDDPQLQEELAGLANRIHSLAADAGGAADLSARGQVYGQMLATCAPCHSRVGGTP